MSTPEAEEEGALNTVSVSMRDDVTAVELVEVSLNDVREKGVVGTSPLGS